jgi:hypothetical protein
MVWYVFHSDLNTNICRTKVKLIIIIYGQIIINLINISIKFELIYN